MRPVPLRPLELLLFAAIGCRAPEATDPGGDTGDTGDTAAAPACVNPESILLASGEPSGFERCADGAVNRVAPATFDPTNPAERCRGDEDEFFCTDDATCGDGPYGACVHQDDRGDMGWPNGACGCEYACASDADCADGEACVPAEARDGATRPTCEPATCRAAEDCATGECGLGNYDNGCGWSDTLTCRTPDDGCHGDGECDGDAGQSCDVNDPTLGFGCVAADCDIGRPLLVEDAPRVAPPAPRGDWAAAVVPTPVPPAVAAALATHWRTVAALEHASVGSFARFTLQLLALGAPAALLRDTQAAAADEVRHAEAAYALASAYAGAPVGPGPLPLHGAMPALDAAGVAGALVDEACVGETLGAAEAAAAAAACADPVVRAVLAGIARDEAAHAALAWRALRWLLDTAPALRPAVVERLAAACAAHEARLAAVVGGPDLAAYGVPAPGDRAAAQRRALRLVVGPVAAALLGGAARA